jgi:hypothetical protein
MPKQVSRGARTPLVRSMLLILTLAVLALVPATPFQDGALPSQDEQVFAAANQEFVRLSWAEKWAITR